jgi:hypothetical protein
MKFFLLLKPKGTIRCGKLINNVMHVKLSVIRETMIVSSNMAACKISTIDAEARLLVIHGILL